MTASIKPQSLLIATDPKPVEIVNENSHHPLLLVCEHAGQAIPERLNNLGLSAEQLDSHIGWDIGAEAVTRAIALALGAPAVIQRYSRLVIDCNRPPIAPDAMPEVSDGIEIPGNQALNAAACEARVSEIFRPFHETVESCFEQHPRRIVLSIHSFTSSMNGAFRPWELGFLFRKDVETSGHLSRFIQNAHPDMSIGMNQPYQIDDVSDWFVPQHGEARAVPHSLIEIRNDLIREPEDQEKWADILISATQLYLKEV